LFIETKFSFMKTINIIGERIAGLSAGCHLQRNGYKTRIFEMHNIPGGLCTSWKRGDYTFDGCIHWLVGSKPGSDFNKMWKEVLDIDKIRFVDYEIYTRAYDPSNNFIDIFTNISKLEKELLEKAPEDTEFIKSMIRSMRKLSGFKMNPDKAPEVMSLADGIKMFLKFIPYMPEFKKWNIRTREIASHIKNPLFRSAIYNSFDPDMSFIFFMFTLIWMDKKDAGYPVGGSQIISGMIESKYLELGGQILYNNKVEKIITEKANKQERACSVLTTEGSEHPSDITISAADGYSTIYLMLDGNFLNKRIENYYNNFLPFPSYFQVSLGINDPLNNIAHSQLFPLKQPLVFDPETTHNELHFRTFSEDPGVAPQGKTTVTFLIPTRNYEYWFKLRQDDYNRYQNEKKRILNQVIEELNNHIPGIKEKVKKTDLSTPATVIRYTNNWKGSFEGWVMTPETGLKQIKKTLPGLTDFYMIGHWVEPGGGLPSVLRSGRNVAQLICKKDRKQFKSK